MHEETIILFLQFWAFYYSLPIKESDFKLLVASPHQMGVCQEMGKLGLVHRGHAELLPKSPTDATDMDLVVQVLCLNSV